MQKPISSKQPYATMHDFLQDRERAQLEFYSRHLKSKANTAVAWGVPDRESTGYSHSELTSIISQLLNYIERLENVSSTSTTKC